MNHKPFVTTELKPLPDAVQELIAERDEWKARCEFSFSERDKLSKERDALKAELARPESTAVSLMRAENAALKDAARLALDALEQLHTIDTETEIVTIWVEDEIAALKAVL